MLTGTRLLPFVDDSPVFANRFHDTMSCKDEILRPREQSRPQHPPHQVYHTATQVGEHLGMEMDFE
jgi:hypothetical protein